MGDYVVGNCGCCGGTEPFGALRVTVSWQRFILGTPPSRNEFFEEVLQCLSTKSFTQNNTLTRWSLDISKGIGSVADPIEDFCDPAVQPVVTSLSGRPDSFIRRSRTALDGQTFYGAYYAALGADMQRARISNPTRQTMIIWRYMETWETGAKPPVITHLSCRAENDAAIVLSPILDDSGFPRFIDGSQPQENEVIWERAYTLAEAATLPAPFPQDCLNLLP